MGTKSQKSRLKKRINAYRIFNCNFVVFFDSNFRGVFNPMMVKKNIESANRFGTALNEMIEILNEEECLELNQRLDCYQIDNRQDS